jgi:hypothetical protein
VQDLALEIPAFSPLLDAFTKMLSVLPSVFLLYHSCVPRDCQPSILTVGAIAGGCAGPARSRSHTAHTRVNEKDLAHSLGWRSGRATGSFSFHKKEAQWC